MSHIYNRSHLPRIGYTIDTPVSRLALRYWNVIDTRKKTYITANEYYDVSKSSDTTCMAENIPYSIRNKIEKCCSTIDILTTTKQLALLTVDNNLLDNTIFYILPFQKLMLLEYVCQMINRCSLNEFIPFLILLLSSTLRIPHITWSKCVELSQFFCKQVSVHIIPRRHGKTTFMHSLMALEIFFPEAGLKILYCAHHSKLPDSTFAAINSLLPRLSSLINKYEIKSYKERQLTAQSKEDFYYNVTYKVYQSKKSIQCFFTKYNKKGRLIQSQQPTTVNADVLSNTIECRVYGKQNVSKSVNVFINFIFNI